MKKLLFIFFLSIGFLTSCVENPVEDPLPLPAPGNVTALYNDGLFSSVDEQVVVTSNSMSLKATQEDGSYFKLTLPETALIGTYTWSTYAVGAPGFYMAYFESPDAVPFVAARDNVGEFAPFPNYVDTAELVIYGIDKVNKRIFGTFKFTGVRFTDDTQSAVETRVFTNGFFENLPYTTTPIVDPTPETVVLRQTIDVYTTGNVITTDYNYNGNKLVSIISNDALDPADLYFTYTGNLITKAEYKFEDGTVEQTETFEYNAAGLLIAYKLIVPDDQEGYGFRYTYTHNGDGTITGTRYIGNATTQEDLSRTETITVANNSVSSIVDSTGSSLIYTYDTKNHPLKNVAGLSKIIFAGGEGTSFSRNLTREDITNGAGTTTVNYVYQYLPNNYPTQSTQDEGNGEYTTQYIYE